MKTILELTELIKTGKTVDVHFLEAIEDKECYPEENMRARILKATRGPDGLVKVLFDFEPFRDYNIPLEKPTYYDKSGSGEPCLTATQAGYYKPQDEIFFEEGELIADSMVLSTQEASALFARYQASGTKVPYVCWLEDQLSTMEANIT